MLLEGSFYGRKEAACRKGRGGKGGVVEEGARVGVRGRDGRE
jgi:hypothetical protein